VTETPSARLIAAAQQVAFVHDKIGRILGLRQLTALDRLRLFKVLGAELSLNPAYLGVATLAYSVQVIDDVPVPPPVTEAALEGLVHRLGDAGLSAIADALTVAVTTDTEHENTGN
jgi:hypothetical protein